jgi:hypothetical protein
MLKEELIKKGVCTEYDIDIFLATQKEKRRLEQEKYQKEKEERDLLEFERLKAKFADGKVM